MINSFINKSGQSLVELVIALGIFAILVSSLMVFSGNGLNVIERSKYYMKASALLDEGENVIFSIEENNWNYLNKNNTSIATSSGHWILGEENSVEYIGDYRRTVVINDVYRNLAGEQVDENHTEAITDLLSKYVTLGVYWEIADNEPIEIDKKILISHYNASKWAQDIWSIADAEVYMPGSYDLSSNIDTSGSDLKLSMISSSSFTTSGYLESSAFDTGEENNFTVVRWTETIDEGCFECKTELRLKTALDDNGNPGTWSSEWSGPDGDDGDAIDYFASSSGEFIHTDNNNKQWIKYRLDLFGNGSSSPIVDDVIIYYN